MNSTLTEKAVVGRRVELALYRDKNNYRPGIITDITSDESALRIRLDGTRYNIPTRTDPPYLRYLDEIVTPVPALPMGPFLPEASNANGFWEHNGVLWTTIGEDGDELLLLTDDRDKAVDAAMGYLNAAQVDVACVHFDSMRPLWAVFEWQPEDAEMPWLVRWDAAEGDEHAIRIHYLPA